MEQGKYYSGKEGRGGRSSSSDSAPGRGGKSPDPESSGGKPGRSSPPGKGGKSPDPESNGGKPGRSSPPGGAGTGGRPGSSPPGKGGKSPDPESNGGKPGRSSPPGGAGTGGRPGSSPPGKGGKSPDPESNGGKPGRSSPPGAPEPVAGRVRPLRAREANLPIRNPTEANREGRLLPGRRNRWQAGFVPSGQGRQISRSGIQRRQTGKVVSSGAPEPVASRVRLHREKKEGRRGLARRQEKQENHLSPEPKAARRRGRRAKGRNPKAAFPPEVFQVHWNLLFQHCRRPNRLAFRPSAKLLLFHA